VEDSRTDDCIRRNRHDDWHSHRLVLVNLRIHNG